MAKKKKSSSVNWIDSITTIFSGIVDTIVEHSDAKIEEIKKKTVHYIVIYGIFTVSLLFLLIGLVKYLTEIYVFASEGIGFIVMGSAMIVILSAYSLVHRA